jgi:hypothetical protein
MCPAAGCMGFVCAALCGRRRRARAARVQSPPTNRASAAIVKKNRPKPISKSIGRSIDRCSRSIECPHTHTHVDACFLPLPPPIEGRRPVPSSSCVTKQGRRAPRAATASESKSRAEHRALTQTRKPTKATPGVPPPRGPNPTMRAPAPIILQAFVLAPWAAAAAQGHLWLEEDGALAFG